LTGENNSSEQVETFILKDIFLKKEYQMIRACIDESLSRARPSKKMLKQYGNGIHVVRDDCVLHRAALEGNANIIEFLLDSVRSVGHTNTASGLLIGQDENRRTVWHMAAIGGNIQLLEKLWEFAKGILREEEIKNKLLLATDIEEYTAWHLAIKGGKPDILQKMWEWARENLTKEEVKNNLLLATDNMSRTAWHVAAYFSTPDVLQKIWDTIIREIMGVC